MSIVLSHISALEYWRKFHLNPAASNKVVRAKRLLNEGVKIGATLPAGIQGISQPFHVLIADERNRQRNRLFITHTWTKPLDIGSVYHIEGEFYISSPELCFIQLATILPFVDLIAVGFELCGIYSTADTSCRKGHPLTSTHQLKSFVEAYRNMRGAQKAFRALAYIIDNSASPMETILAMLLSLPFRMGGYGFEKPLLNEPIEKSNREGSTLSKYFVADLLWPSKKVILEYDSDKHHSDTKSHTSDSIRRAELAELDYTVISVIRPHVTTALGNKNLAILLAKQTTRRLRIPNPTFSNANAELRKTLLNFRNPYIHSQ